MDKRVEKYAGIVVFNNGKYYLRTSKGKQFDVVQNEDIEQIHKSHSVCVFEVKYNEKHTHALGNIVSIVGNINDPIPEGRAIAESYDLLRNPDVNVMEEVMNIPQEVIDQDIKGIADLRDVPFITIDPDTAKDFDDAVFACKNPDGTYTLRVAISNVANYVKPDSELFKWAMEGGNSSYLGATCNPMLPHELSNGICSLNEKVDRIVMCTTCTMDKDGKLLNYTIEPAVINSRHRLTYKEADYIYFGENHEGDTQDHTGKDLETIDIHDSLSSLYDVAQILYKARMDRGAFDIDSQKLAYLLNEAGDDVLGYEYDHSEEFTSVIEETAIITNEIWGEVSQMFDLPFYYRNHKSIEAEKVSELRKKLEPYGIKLPKKVNGKALQSIINQVKGKRIEEYIVTSILKTMESAYYDTENYGHTGLAIIPNNYRSNKHEMIVRNQSRKEAIDSARRAYFKQTGRHNGFSFEGDIAHMAYAHTTSPIRRGADLGNQLQMLEFMNNEKVLFKRRKLKTYCENLNVRERNAAKAENEYDNLLAAKWASNNMGKVFRDCTVVSLEQHCAIVSTKDGYKMSLPYSGMGEKRKYLKIGLNIDAVKIDKVTLYPASVVCTTKVLENELETNDSFEMI